MHAVFKAPNGSHYLPPGWAGNIIALVIFLANLQSDFGHLCEALFTRFYGARVASFASTHC